ncbi:MAG TPA: hypothetical protein VMP67_11245, partial [Candidatus Limnocylindria bacterium]|nr:hypothetical protein [Candidatus Limnocylindria bacterium]
AFQCGHNVAMSARTSSRPPAGVIVLLAYGLALLVLLSLSLPLVVDQAIEAPISVLGLLWMLLLAYLIFTITLTLQRKRAAWGLALGLASLSLPLILLLLWWGGLPGAGLGLLLAAILFLSLRGRRVRAWFSEP